MKAVIFDRDGTLVDSEVLSNEVLVEVVAEYGLVISLAEAIAAFRGRKMADCVSALEQRLGRAFPADFVRQFRGKMSTAFREKLRPVDGAVDLVRSIRQPFCVASSGPRDKIELSLSLTSRNLQFVHSIQPREFEKAFWALSQPEPAAAAAGGNTH
jgi:beta-phosphoglucomutase-like phosphatase (HAD superfamily)